MPCDFTTRLEEATHTQRRGRFEDADFALASAVGAFMVSVGWPPVRVGRGCRLFVRTQKGLDTVVNVSLFLSFFLSISHLSLSLVLSLVCLSVLSFIFDVVIPR